MNKTAFGVVFVVALVAMTLSAQGQQMVNQGCSQMSNGNIIVSPYVQYGPALPATPLDATPKATLAPRKVTLTEDLADDVQVCRETADGAVCKTVGAIFK